MTNNFNNSGLLTLIIPTYNRATVLDRNLAHIVELQNKYDFHVILCNNGSNDNAEEIINKWKDSIMNLKLITHKTNIGYGKNIISGIKSCDTRYFWIIGNKNYITDDNMGKVLECISYQPDAIVVNANLRYDLPNKIYTDNNEIIIDLGWRLSHLSSMIFKRELVNEDLLNYEYSESIYTFIHMYIWLNSIAQIADKRIYFYSDIIVDRFSIDIRENNVVYWTTKMFEVFGKFWYETIIGLSNEYSLEAKYKCIRLHDMRTGLFSPYNIMKNKLSGVINVHDYFANRKYMKYVLYHSIFYIDLIIVFVPRLSNRLLSTIKKITNK